MIPSDKSFSISDVYSTIKSLDDYQVSLYEDLYLVRKYLLESYYEYDSDSKFTFDRNWIISVIDFCDYMADSYNTSRKLRAFARLAKALFRCYIACFGGQEDELYLSRIRKYLVTGYNHVYIGTETEDCNNCYSWKPEFVEVEMS